MNQGKLFFFVVINAVLLFYFLLHGSQLVLLLISLFRGWLQRRGAPQAPADLLSRVAVIPPVTLLAPAHNEQATITDSIHSLLALQYPKLEVIVINDGSTDGTLAVLNDAFALRKADLLPYSDIPVQVIRAVYISTFDSRLLVIDKAQGGKSDALNAGLNFSRTPWVCCVDADSVLEPDALLRAMRPALDDNTVVASSGIVRIANGCSIGGGRVLSVGLPVQKLARFQVVEYLQDFLTGRIGWSWLNGLLIVSGAFGLFRAATLRAIGGYSRETVTEDMELVVRIHRYYRERKEPYRVVFVPDPVCWTEVPVSTASLRRQRRRWHRGLMEVLVLHRSAFFSRSSGLLGWLVLPQFVLVLLAPAVSLLGYALLLAGFISGWLKGETILMVTGLAILLDNAFATAAVMLEEMTYRRYVSLRDLLILLSYAFIQHFGYQQIISWWRVEGLYEYFRGRRNWGEQKRTGFLRSINLPSASSENAGKNAIAR